MSRRYETFGRVNQKQRTRRALKDAATELVRQGDSPTVAEVADAALVTRSTAYRYFPSRDALLAEVVVDLAVSEDMQQVFQAADSPGPAEQRVVATVRADHAMVAGHESAFRSMLRAVLAVDASDRQPRAGNRLRYIATAIEPVADVLGPERSKRLVAALSLVCGIEAAVVVSDICELRGEDAADLKAWAATALVRQALLEAPNDASRALSHRAIGAPPP